MIKKFEGLVLHAYRDRGGIWTIGYGRARGVHPDGVCTSEQAEAWLLEDIEEVERLLLARIPTYLTDNQLSALVSFVYNVGMGYVGHKDGFEVLKCGGPSTMLECILEGDFAGAAEEFPKWDDVNGQPCDGIRRRRVAEQALFVKPDTV